MHMTSGTDELHFFYDAQNRPAVVVYNGTAYAYVKSLQGDIVAILDENGNTVVSYGYDAWGVPLWCTGELAETLGKVQPFRYRGYVFDEETGLYYLRSRYYNAALSRFINMDSVLLKGILKSNQQAYCINNPILYSDSNGHDFLEDIWKLICNAIDENQRIAQENAQAEFNAWRSLFNKATVAGDFQEGVLRGSGSLTAGYAEANARLQGNLKENVLGVFGKISAGNAAGKIGVGNDDVSASLKGVADLLSATLTAGISIDTDVGAEFKAKAAVFSGRATTELDLFAMNEQIPKNIQTFL